jgi:hypothetical protein
LFNTFFKQWKYIFYLDCGITIFRDISPILNEITENTLLAHSDAYPNYEWKLHCQFDKTIDDDNDGPWDDEKEWETMLAKVGYTPQDQGGNHRDNEDNNNNNKRCEELFVDFVNGEAHGYGPAQVDSEGSLRWRRQKQYCC